MPAAGQDAREHIMRKYGIDAAQSDANRKALRERAAAVGFDYNVRDGSRVWNTFDAHRLLHWAETQDNAKALLLKQALFRAYFTNNENVADHEVLVRAAIGAGLDADAARRVLASDAYTADVREQERRYQQAGIHSVPATIVNGQYLISGGQPPEAFVDALREIATKSPAN
jgi:predicted DsbA family dithiol-disulfide isomerase